MDITFYTSGKGIELSESKTLNDEQVLHHSQEPNNLYSLKQIIEPETLDFVYIKDIINKTKFHRIIIKESFYVCKIGGFIIIEMSSNNLLKFNDLKDELKTLIGEKVTIIKEEYNPQTEKGTIIAKKDKAALKSNDSIEKWTFGIVTNGARNDWVEKQISSIQSQNIPEYEIIICGKYFDRKEQNIRYIQFTEKDDRGWITKKKNLICENAKYENLVIMHDRIVLNKNWFNGIKKYGKYFEVLSCKIHDKKENRCGDWITYGNKYNKFGKVGLLDYKDWDKYGCLDGAFYILKKSAWEKAKWDETLFWNESEDAKLSSDWYKKGIVARFNPFCSCLTLSWRHGELPIYEFNDKKLSNYPKRLDIMSIIKFYIKKVFKNFNIIM